MEIRLSETSLSQQIKGLNSDLYDAGFAQSDEVGEDIMAVPFWSEPLVVAVPARHPILVHLRIPLDEVLRYPLVLFHPEICEGFWQQVKRVLARWTPNSSWRSSANAGFDDDLGSCWLRVGVYGREADRGVS